MPSFFPNNAAPLPQFKSLLVKGPYHPSAPIHLALSELEQPNDSTALLISSSSIHLNLSLRQYNDDWLSSHSGQGKLNTLASRLQIFYPPTPAHLVYLLSMFHVVDSTASEVDIASSKAVLASPPALIVLHELSTYFLRDTEADPNHHKWTVSSYLNMVVQTESLISFLIPSKTRSAGTISLVLFDSRIDELKLPVVQNPSNESNPFPGIFQPSRPEGVSFLVQKYFQYTATFSEDGKNAEQDQSERRSMHYDLIRHDSPEDVNTIRWAEKREPCGEGWKTQIIL